MRVGDKLWAKMLQRLGRSVDEFVIRDSYYVEKIPFPISSRFETSWRLDYIIRKIILKLKSRSIEENLELI